MSYRTCLFCGKAFNSDSTYPFCQHCLQNLKEIGVDLEKAEKALIFSPSRRPASSFTEPDSRSTMQKP
jgi:hypothetical protein